MHKSDFECECGRKFFVGGRQGIYKCESCKIDINFGDFVEPTVDPKLIERVARKNRYKAMSQRRSRIKAALQTRAQPGEQLGDLVARFSTESTSPILRAYLSAWLSECGCQLEVAIANLNSRGY